MLLNMIKPKENKSVVEIDLTGPEGNAFVLLGTATRLARQLGLDEKEVTAKMTAGDYDNLVEVMEHYFGDYVVMYR